MNPAVAEMKRQIQERKREIDHLQGLVSRMPLLQRELVTLESALNILEPKEPKAIIKQTGQQQILSAAMNIDRVMTGTLQSVSEVVHAVLKEAGKTLPMRGIHPLVLAKGKHVSYRTMTSAIYDAIKKGKLFRKVGAGSIGLLEWPEKE